ncbi:MAG: hypothetical protein ACREBU_14400, partial [Nitrososphaera sp.]
VLQCAQGIDNERNDIVVVKGVYANDSTVFMHQFLYHQRYPEHQGCMLSVWNSKTNLKTGTRVTIMI